MQENINVTKLAADIVKDKLEIIPAPGSGASPLAQIVSMLPDDVRMRLIEDDSSVDLDMLLSSSDMLDALSSTWADAVHRTISILSEDVSPIVTSAVDYVVSAMEEADLPNIAEQYEIVKVDIETDILDRLYEPNMLPQTTPMFDSALYMLKLSNHEAEIWSLIKSISPNNGLEWLDSLCESNTKGTRLLFEQGASSKLARNAYNYPNALTSINDALYTLLYCSYFSAEPPNYINASLAEFNLRIRNIRQLATYTIKNKLHYLDILKKQEVLILGSEPQLRKVYVYKPMYTRYIEEGGVADAILGKCVSSSGAKSLTEIKDSTIELLKNWKLFVRQNIHTSDVARLSFFKRFIKLAITNIELLDIERDYYASDLEMVEDVDIITKVKQDMFAVVDDLTRKCLDDPELAVTRVICEGRFPYLNCYSWFEDILQYHRNYKDSAMNEAVRAAVINHLAKHVGYYLDVKNK